jgi:hypothetical protein
MSYRMRTRAEWRALVDAMNASEWFILIASPEAACSMPVNREIDWWLDHRSLDHVAVAFDAAGRGFGDCRGALSPAILPRRLRSRAKDLRTVVPLTTGFESPTDRRRFRRSARPLAEAIYGVTARAMA